jgi:O-antigen/teichoic acid export membrane protein
VSLFAAPVIAIMAAPEYAAAASIVPIVSLAYLFFSLPPHFNVPARLSKNTATLLPASYAAAATNVVSNVVLIPRMGPAGAAWASVVTFAVYAGVVLAVCRRIRVIPYPGGRIALVFLALLADYAVYVGAVRAGLSGMPLHALAALLWLIPAVLMFRPVLLPGMRYLPGFPGGRPKIGSVSEREADAAGVPPGAAATPDAERVETGAAAR